MVVFIINSFHKIFSGSPSGWLGIFENLCHLGSFKYWPNRQRLLSKMGRQCEKPPIVGIGPATFRSKSAALTTCTTGPNLPREVSPEHVLWRSMMKIVDRNHAMASHKRCTKVENLKTKTDKRTLTWEWN